MRLYLVDMTYPHRKVAPARGHVKDRWKYRRVGRLPVIAGNAVEAAEMFIAHISAVIPRVFGKHAASCRIYVSEHELDGSPGIKFAIGGNADTQYIVRESAVGGYFPTYVGEF